MALSHQGVGTQFNELCGEVFRQLHYRAQMDVVLCDRDHQIGADAGAVQHGLN